MAQRRHQPGVHEQIDGGPLVVAELEPCIGVDRGHTSRRLGEQVRDHTIGACGRVAGYARIAADDE